MYKTNNKLLPKHTFDFEHVLHYGWHLKQLI